MSEGMRVLVVDDEPLARKGMLALLAELEGLGRVDSCSNGREALEWIEAHAPELVLLDIEMPEVNGFELLRALDPSTRPAVIFVTAFDQYAIEAFEAGALDYGLKPVDPQRLRAAVERARARRSERSDGLEARLQQLLQRIEARAGAADRIVTRLGSRIHVVPTKEIDWLEAADNYIRIHAGGREFLHRQSLSSLEQRLDPEEFVRIHRSTLVRLDRIRELRPGSHGDALLLLADGTQLPVSRRHRGRLDQYLLGS